MYEFKNIYLLYGDDSSKKKIVAEMLKEKYKLEYKLENIGDFYYSKNNLQLYVVDINQFGYKLISLLIKNKKPIIKINFDTGIKNNNLALTDYICDNNLSPSDIMSDIEDIIVINEFNKNDIRHKQRC